MTRKDIGTHWDRDNRNAMNDNFIKLFKEYTDAGLNAKDARDKAEQAVADALLAKDTATTTRDEMLAIIREQTQNGDLAPEITQARGEHETVGERLNSSDSQLAQTSGQVTDLENNKADASIVSNELSNKVDRNGNEQVSWGMLDQTAKENITGGNTAVVGVDSVNTSNIVDGATNRSKLSSNFMESGSIPVEQSIDIIYDDGNYIVTAGNIGTFPSGETNAGWALSVKKTGNFVTQEIYKLTNPSHRYVRRLSKATGAVYEWNFIGKQEIEPFKPSMIPEKSLENSMLTSNFLFRGRIDTSDTIDVVYDDGTYIITGGNPGTFPSGESNSGWAMEVKNIDDSWVYQTIFKLTDPSIRYIRLVRSNTGDINDWYRIQTGNGNTPTPGTSNRTFKILMVGNSFALDATSYLHYLAASAGINLIVGILYRDGEGLQSHWENVSQDLANYRYYKRVSQDGSSSQNTSYDLNFNDAVLDEEWNLVTFQQRSGHSTDYASYQPYLNNLKEHVKTIATNENVEFGIHQTWAYSTSRRENQIDMYENIVDAYEQAMNESDIGVLIPNGTSIQNGRANEYLVQVDDELTDDGIHLGVTGDYIAALTMFEALLAGSYKRDIFHDVNYIPDGVSKHHAYLSKIVAKNAVLNPFKVTSTK